MCGIAGWVSYDGEVKARWDVIAKMTETMALRGPDAKGIFIDRHVGLGHRRLAKALEDMLDRPLRNTSSLPDRAGFERARSIGAWMNDYGVELDL
jgi:asparagine synthetase B (glutamine-hydrolysing)